MPAEWLVVRLAAPMNRLCVPKVCLSVERDGELGNALGVMPFRGITDVQQLWDFIFDQLWKLKRHTSVGLLLLLDGWEETGTLPVILETITRIIGYEMEVGCVVRRKRISSD